ncbi:MAG TPA: hypothetical protein VII23_08685 [Terriglobales bacterium]
MSGAPGSFRHHMTGEAGTVEIESPWTAGRREKMGLSLRLGKVPINVR